MKNLTIAVAILATALEILAIQDANATDLTSASSSDQMSYAFAGIGIGVDGGGQFSAWDISPDGVPASFDGVSSDGLLGGAHVEYLFAIDRFRLGAYAEGGFSNVNTTFDSSGFNAELQQDSYYGAGLKIGVTAYGNTLIFVRGGYDWSQWTASASGNDDIHPDVGSWLVGGGIETMVSRNVSVGVGVDYLMLDNVSGFEGAPDVNDALADSEAIRAKLRLTWRN